MVAACKNANATFQLFMKIWLIECMARSHAWLLC